MDWGCLWSLAIDQAVQNIEDVGFGRHPGFKGQFDCAEYTLLIMLSNEGEDFDHLPVTTKPFEQMPLQLPEGFGHFQAWRSIAQSARLELNNCQIVPHVLHRLPPPLLHAFDTTFL